MALWRQQKVPLDSILPTRHSDSPDVLTNGVGRANGQLHVCRKGDPHPSGSESTQVAVHEHLCDIIVNITV
jgi:hypothetical protein